MITKIDFTCSECKKEYKQFPAMISGNKDIDRDIICGACFKKNFSEKDLDIYRSISVMIRGTNDSI